MGWLDGILFRSRRRREARRKKQETLQAALDAEGPDAVWPALVAALEEDPEDEALYRVAGRALLSGDARRVGELFDRAADAPHDPQRRFELGSALLAEGEAEAAAAVLEGALALAPFDAVVRSELALAHARSGRPAKVRATLALHPCLGDDPGALFELAWASLLEGDLDTAERAGHELHGAPVLRHKLELALDRARAGPLMHDARDYYFVEHGGVLLDGAGPLGGRYATLDADAAWMAQAIADAGAVLERLVPSPRRVVAIDDAHAELAQALARACRGALVAAGRGRLPSAIVPLWSAASLEALAPESRRAPELWLFALTADHRRTIARAPELVGAFAREVTLARGPLPEALPAPSSTILDFVESRRAYLPPRGERVPTAYVPDAPLPR
ncbi:MAG: hypothetical protein KF729_31325 [Sandaracinaceae bacterium]|nr:hypothetical protein [Sandaracinaceae bacterium]